MTAAGGRGAPMSRAGVVPGTRMGLTTGMNEGYSEARPMTSVSGAGYKSTLANESKNFDPLNMSRAPAAALAEKSENSHEDKAKEMEKGVHRLIEATATAIADRDFEKALEKAKEAGKAERALSKFRESHNLVDHINADLTYAICFNLANAYYHNKLYDEALNTYQLIVKNKNYPQSGRLKLNMGVIYYEQKKYPQAIKFFRMSLDQIPATNKELRFKIMRNIGNAFIKLGQFQDAIDSYDGVMNGSPDIQSAFNLMLCLYARGDKDKMRKHFLKMLTIPVPGMTEDDEDRLRSGHHSIVGSDEDDIDIHISEQTDQLKEELNHRYEMFQDRILTAARLIAPVIDEKEDWVSGYQLIIEQLRNDYETVSSKLEIDLAMEYMKKRKFEDAIDVLKSFEKKDPSLRAMAATNLSFLYFLETDYAAAEKQADLAIKSDRYNAKALVNKGNCLFVNHDYQHAREMYLEAVGVEADCIEAIYNLGLVNLELNAVEEAKNAFDKLYTILPSVPEALFQLGAINERQGNFEEASKTYERLLSRVPGDPNICLRLGQVYEKLEDENTACHWRTEAHRHYPVDLNNISWLGVWYVKREMYEQAIEYFERAAAVQPGEVKWRLMITSCYRRLGDFYKALELYQQIHEDHPENLEALQYLEALCKDLGRSHEEITKKLEKLRRNQPQQPQQQTVVPAANAGARNANQPQRSERPNRQPERSERPNNNAAQQRSGNRGLEELTEGAPTNVKDNNK
jgi:intraflagellar transport protein 88